MSDIPSDLKFLSSHEWVRVEEGEIVFVGISDHAQAAMGDLVYVELPETGIQLSAGEEAGVVESVKAASDIYAPVSGTVLEVNETLLENPEAVNTDPYDDGWMFKVKLSDLTELDSLLSSEDYALQLESEAS